MNWSLFNYCLNNCLCCCFHPLLLLLSFCCGPCLPFGKQLQHPWLIWETLVIDTSSSSESAYSNSNCLTASSINAFTLKIEQIKNKMMETDLFIFMSYFSTFTIFTKWYCLFCFRVFTSPMHIGNNGVFLVIKPCDKILIYFEEISQNRINTNSVRSCLHLSLCLMSFFLPSTTAAVPLLCILANPSSWLSHCLESYRGKVQKGVFWNWHIWER